MEHSRTEALAQVLMNSIGPLWEGTPNLASAQDWLVQVYTSWGVPARKEQYGSITHRPVAGCCGRIIGLTTFRASPAESHIRFPSHWKVGGAPLE